MKRIVLTLLSLINLVSFLQAQWQRQYPMPKLEEMFDIVVKNDGYGFAVGTDDLAQRFNNSTKEWQLLPDTEFGWTLFAVDYLTGTNGMYVAAGGTGLIISENGGASWEKITGAPIGIQKIKILAEDLILVIGGSGVHRWNGIDWTSLNAPVMTGFIGGFILDANHIWAYTGGTDPTIYYTADGGGQWDSSDEIERPDAINFYDTQYGVAFDNRRVYQTVDGGNDWTEVSNNAIHNSISDVTFGETANIMMAATLNGDPAFSIDSGLSWEQLEMDLLNQRSYSIANIGNEYWVGNDLSSIGYTPDSGMGWTERAGPRREPIHDIFFINRNIGIAVGFDGNLLRTTNGGSFWEDVSFESERHYWSAHGTSADHLWLGANQRIYFSSDTGQTWATKATLAGGSINDILAISNTRILAASSSGIIYRSNDSGTSWDTVYQTNTQLRSLAKIDNQRYMATGFNGIILRSEDQGETWSLLTPPEAAIQYEEAFFLDNDGWLITSTFRSKMWHTSNAGDSWDQINLPIDRAWNGMYFITQDTGVVVASSAVEGRAYLTYNGGLNWEAGYVTDFPLLGASGVHNPNGTAWIYGAGSDIEILPYCTTLPTIDSLMGNFLPCQGDTIQYTVTGEDVDEYFWIFPLGWQVIGNATNDTIHVRVGSQSGNVSVTGVNTCGFTSAINAAATPTLLPLLSLITGPATPCEGELIEYSVTGSAGDFYQWSIPGTDWSIVSGQGTNVILVEVGTTAGNINVQGGNVCGQDEATPLHVDPALLPVALSIEGDLNPCTNSPTLYIYTGQFTDEVSWELPVDWVVIEQPDPFSLLVLPGQSDGILTVLGTNECGNSNSLDYNVTAEDLPDVVIGQQVGTNTLVGDFVGVAIAYQWYLDGAAIIGATSITYDAVESGNYTLEVTLDNGCTGISNVLNVTIVGIADAYDDPSISIVPNPVYDAFQLTGLQQETPFEIIDMHGQVCQRGSVFTDPIAIGQLAAGVYVIRLQMEDRMVIKRLTVVNAK